jgi:hypothetical protein
MRMNWLSDRFTIRSLPLLAGALLMAAGAGACTVTTTDNAVVVPAGRLIVDWTIQGSTDPSLCAISGVDNFDITIFDSSGEQFGGFKAACSSFATTISVLPPGSYDADALLMTGNVPRTTTVHINPFVITSSDLAIPVDFPADSFL